MALGEERLTVPTGINISPRDFVMEMHRRDRVLSVFSWIHVGLLVLTALVACLDSRIILGVNAWNKPMQFMIAIPIFLWTVAWLKVHVHGPKWLLQTISWGTAISLSMVTVCVSLQSARGTTSSYNLSTPVNAAVYWTMGIAIGLATVFPTLQFAMFFLRKVKLPKAYLWGIRLGFLVFLLASAEGGLMAYYMSHTIGQPDGGPGLPFVDWSTRAGDLRVAHMVGIHSLQVIPLFGFLISCWKKEEGINNQIRYVIAFSVLYLAIVTILLIQALAGLPFLAL